jgi:hypothetical protein
MSRRDVPISIIEGKTMGAALWRRAVVARRTPGVY